MIPSCPEGLSCFLHDPYYVMNSLGKFAWRFSDLGIISELQHVIRIQTIHNPPETTTKLSSPMDGLPQDFVPIDFDFEHVRRDRDGNPYIVVNPVKDPTDPSLITLRIPINNTPSQLLPMHVAKREYSMTLSKQKAPADFDKILSLRKS